MKSLSTDQLAEIAGAGNLLRVILAWRTFKRTHDVKDAKVCCCKHTLALFDKLDALEQEIVPSQDHHEAPPGAA